MKPQALKALERDLRVILEDATGPDASRALAKAWKGAHEDVLRQAAGRSGVAPGFTVAADNDQSKSVETAQSIIVSVYDYRREVTDAIIAALIANSPKRSGAYMRGHMIYVNGKPVGQSCPVLKEDDAVSISNTVAYARRLEIGKSKSGKPFVIQVPPRIYERTMKEVRGTYRNVAKLWFTYRAVIRSTQVDQDKTFSRGRWRKGGIGARAATGSFEKTLTPAEHNKSDIRYPTIVIEAP